MSFPRYPKYKPSGVEWLGEVPEHWEVKRLKHLVANENYAGIQTGPFGGMLTDVLYQEEGEFKVYGQENVLSGDFEKGIRWIAGERFEALSNYHANSGDLLFTRKGSIGGCCSFPVSARPGIIDSDTIRVSLNQEVISQAFLLLAFKFSQYQEAQIQMLKRGAILSGLNTEVLANLVILTPPLPEQTQIAAFLDRETAKIDELVAEQRRLMELLKEKRQAVISHAVTQGLNPKAPMKPSGIEWLGDVPEHWKVLKMKWVAEMQSGHTPDKKIPAYWDDGDIPWISLNDTGFLKDNDYITETAYNISSLGLANSSARMLPERVVVFSRDATIGRCAITTRPMAVSQHFIAWVCGENIVPEYLLLRLRSMTGELDRLTTGATLKTIGMPDVRTLVTPLPPLREQHAIVKWVSEETAKFDTLTAEAQRAIDLLQERRTALISAAVTGQIDVRALPKKQHA